MLERWISLLEEGKAIAIGLDVQKGDVLPRSSSSLFTSPIRTPGIVTPHPRLQAEGWNGKWKVGVEEGLGSEGPSFLNK